MEHHFSFPLIKVVGFLLVKMFNLLCFNLKLKKLL